ncbi:hypothetical protein ACFE04_004740 [Oxalis oulophora]
MFLQCSLLFLHIVVVATCLNDEGLALLSFQATIQNLPLSWNSSADNPCAWKGIGCRDNKVVSLNLANNNLSGNLSPALGNLTSLHRINLRGNYFNGSLPVELFNAKGLQSLVLSGNQFSGQVPPEICYLKYLQTLDLSRNLFNGSILSCLTQCSRLKILVLSRNSFEGSLPDGIGISLTKLQQLNLSWNRLGGEITADLGNLSSLQGTLDLSHNLFTGSVPANLGNLPMRVDIDLSYNNLSGPIPQNGILEYVGPTAFIGNSLLCGLPLKNSCRIDPNSQPLAGNPSNRTHLSSCTLITIVAGVIFGTCIVGGLVLYLYKTRCVSKGDKQYGFENNSIIGKDMLCFLNNDLEMMSQNPEQCHFVPLDSQVNFDLEHLLKAPSFLLGKSALGILYKVVLDHVNTVAVRRFGDGGTQRYKEFQNEAEAIGKIKHPNIVRLLAYCWTVDEKLLIYEHIPNGDLATAIHGKAGLSSFKPLSWHIRLRIMKGVAKGLTFLHEYSPKKYVHGNLKPSNILLGENTEPKISDFGLSRLASITEEGSMRIEHEPMTPPTQGSPYELTPTRNPTESYYQAHEASKITKPSQKWDVYSFGVILLELISGKLPLIQVGSSEIELVRWIQLCIEVGKPLFDVLDPFLAREFLDKEEEIVAVLHIALACVHKTPEKRPSMKYVSDNLEKLVPFT